MDAKRTCSIDGCEKASRCRGWCNPHYQRWYKHGDPLMLSQGPTPEARFWKKVDQAGPGGCWLWTGSLTTGGYGQFWNGEHLVPAHRFAYEVLLGLIPDGLELDHLCRVRRCVNPHHLEPVTHRENTLRGVSPAARNATKTHCPAGHEYSSENSYVNLAGGRRCRPCQRAHEVTYLARKGAR